MKLPLLLTAAALASLGYADTALVIGVGAYPQLGPRSTLQGPAGDAESMRAALKRHGFDSIQVLTEETATRAAILKALVDAKSSVKPNERFVLYFAGHGRSRPQFAILPYDAKPYDNWITAEDLHALVKAIPARARTVILDSCFSGGMAKSAGLVTRYYEPDDSKGPDPVNETSNAGPLPETKVGGEICYVTAAQKTEEAAELIIDDPNRRQGVFTYYLAKELQGTPRPWEAVMASVRVAMRKQFERYVHYQNPLVTNVFLKQPVFAVAAGTPSPPVDGSPSNPPSASAWTPKDLLDLFESQSRDPERFRLKVSPDEAQPPLGLPFRIAAESRSEGYLVILAESKGKLYRAYPTGTNSARDAFIRANLDEKGQPISNIAPRTIPMASNEAKIELFRAFLFKDEAEAQRLIATVPEFSPSNAFSPSELSKEVIPIGAGMPVVLTSSVVLKPQLRYLGGLEVEDAAAFWTFLEGDSEVAKKARQKLERIDSVKAAIGDSKLRTPDLLCFTVNYCAGYANLFYDPDFEGETFEERVNRSAGLLVAAAKGLRRKEGGK